MFIYPFLEEEFGLNELLQHLKTRASELTAEIAPWAKDFTLKLEDVKTRLDVVRCKGEKANWKTSEYSEMFEETKPHEMPGLPVLQTLRKILVKGRVGHGKSTLAKKITYDWAKGLFNHFSIVFFISMKLVKPGDSIENMTIDQNGLGDLNFTAQKIEGILDKFGSDYSVIIDGLGDHTLKNNEEVLRIVQKEKVNFNFLVTLSETNFPDNIDEYFETISQVQGFNGSDIKSVVAKLGDSHREVVLKWIQSLPETLGDLEQRNPMVILRLSFLVSHDPSTDLGQNLSIFTVYARTILCLLGLVDFESQRNLVKAVGKIAFDVIQSGKVYTKAEV